MPRLDLATCSYSQRHRYRVTHPRGTRVEPVNGDAEAVKVDHQEASCSSNVTCVNTVRPEVAVISIRKDGFEHLSPKVVHRWKL